MTGAAEPDPPARLGGRPGPQVTAVLESLARQCASGVLEIDGNPAGVIYLDRGQITYAQASWAPDLAARFCASQQPPADVRAVLLAGDPDGRGPAGRSPAGRGAAGRGAADHGDHGDHGEDGRGEDDGGPAGDAPRDHDPVTILLNWLSRAELQALLRSVIVDAVLALTVPLSGDATVSGIRFEAPRSHWASAFARLPLDSVREEAVCRAARLARYPVSRTSTVSLRDMDRDSMVLTREQWAIASRIGRTSTVRDLAWRSGLALCDTIECVARLVRAGVCALGPVPATASTAPASTPPTAPASTPPTAPASTAGGAELGGEPVTLPAPGAPEPLPRRRPGAHLVAELRSAREAAEAQLGTALPRPALPVPARYTPPPPDVLHRLLDGLRNLK